MSTDDVAASVRNAARLALVPLLATGIAVLAAFVVTSALPHTYHSSASVVLIPAPQKITGKKTASPIDPSGVGLALNLTSSVARLAESREVAVAVAHRSGLAEDKVIGKITSVAEPGNQIVTIQAEARSAAGAARLADAAAQATTALYGRLNLSGRSQVLLRQLDAAVPPQRAVTPNLRLNLALGALTGLLIGIGAVSLRRGRDRHLRGIADLESVLRLPTLAKINRLPRRWTTGSGRRVPQYRGRAARMSDTLIGTLAMLDPTASGRRIVLTGTGDPAGATAVAALLAVGLHRHGRSCLLVDAREIADRASYRLSRRVGRQGVLVRAEALRTGAVELGDTDGTAALGVLASDGYAMVDLGPLIDQAALAVDDVVVLAGSVWSATGAAALSPHADVFVMITNSDRLSRAQVARAGRLVRGLGIGLSGTVVIGSAADRDGWRSAAWPPIAAAAARDTPAAAVSPAVSPTPLRPAAPGRTTATARISAVPGWSEAAAESSDQPDLPPGRRPQRTGS